MKLKIILLTPFLIATVVWGTIIVPYNNAKSPDLTLSVAYNDALIVLGHKTNQLHCVSANIESSFSSDGDWQFAFYTTNAIPTWVTIEFDGKTHVEEGGMAR
jgi:hypothetical protein